MKLICYSTGFYNETQATHWANRMADLAKKHGFSLYVKHHSCQWFVFRTVCDRDSDPSVMIARETNVKTEQDYIRTESILDHFSARLIVEEQDRARRNDGERRHKVIPLIQEVDISEYRRVV